MQLSIYGKSDEILWTNLALLIFAILFLAIGLQRIVEFKGIELKARTKQILIFFHIFGVICFSSSLGLLSLDIYQLYNEASKVFFLVGTFTLFPLHIYLALRRRIQISRN